MVLKKEFVSLTTVAMGIGKRHFFNYQWKMLQEKQYLIKNMNLTDKNYHWKNWVDRIVDTWWDKTFRPQKCTSWVKEPKTLKKHNNSTFHDYLQQCRSKNRNWFWATRMFKAIINTRNVNDKCSNLMRHAWDTNT